jgi:hypothetical protein
VSCEITSSEAAAQSRYDAEAALVVAAFGDLQVGIVAWREADALRRHQVRERFVRPGQVPVDRLEHLFSGVRAGHGQHARMPVQDALRVGTEAAGDDHLAIRVQCFADRLERLVDGAVDEAAGVDDDEVRVFVARRDLVAAHAQLREDALGIDERLGAAEADKADAWGRGRHRGANGTDDRAV